MSKRHHYSQPLPPPPPCTPKEIATGAAALDEAPVQVPQPLPPPPPCTPKEYLPPPPTPEPVPLVAAAPRRSIRLLHAITVVGIGTGDNFTEDVASVKASTLPVDSIIKESDGVVLTFGKVRYWIPDSGVHYIREVL